MSSSSKSITLTDRALLRAMLERESGAHGFRPSSLPWALNVLLAKRSTVFRMFGVLANHLVSQSYDCADIVTRFTDSCWRGAASVKPQAPLTYCIDKTAKLIHDTKLNGPFQFRISRLENVATRPLVKQKDDRQEFEIRPRKHRVRSSKKSVKFEMKRFKLLGQRHAEAIFQTQKEWPLPVLWRDITLAFPATVWELPESEGQGRRFCPTLEYQKSEWQLGSISLHYIWYRHVVICSFENPEN